MRNVQIHALVAVLFFWNLALLHYTHFTKNECDTTRDALHSQGLKWRGKIEDIPRYAAQSNSPTQLDVKVEKNCETKCSTIIKKANGKSVEVVFESNKINKMSVFHCYPMSLNFTGLIRQIRAGETPAFSSINAHPYKPLTTVDCEDQSYFVVYLIKSRPENVQARNAIRETWANITQISKFSIKHVFLLGLSTNHKVLVPVMKEQEKFGDILQENFVDVYLHTRIKMTMALRWATIHCSKSSFLVLVDDDVFIDPWKVVKYLTSPEVQAQERFYSGTLALKYRPNRIMAYRWYLSPSEYPFEGFPQFPPTGTVFVNMEFARQYVIAWKYISPVHYDDVYLGIVAHKLGVTPLNTDLVKVYCNTTYVEKHYYASCLGEFKPARLKTLWKKHVNFLRHKLVI